MFGWQPDLREEGRELLAWEHFVVMGWPVGPYESAAKHLPSCFQVSPSQWLQSTAQLKSMAGNGMHSAQIGVALLFAIS